MFSYLRFFFGFSIVLILIATILLGWYHRSTAENLVLEKTEEYNVSVANGYINTVWKKYRNLKFGEGISGTSLLLNSVKMKERPSIEEFKQMSAETESYVQKMNLLEFRVYPLREHDVFLSIRNNKLEDPIKLAEREEDIQIYKIALSGKPSSEIIDRDGAKIVRTLAPILRVDKDIRKMTEEEPKAEAIIEITYNAEKNLNSLAAIQYIGMGLIITIFGILFATLIYTYRRAEKIIARQHDTNMDLVSAKAKAEAANDQKSQFLASISHELRTPLNAIIGFSEIIKDEVMGALGNDQYKNYIRDIHSSGVHLLSLINDILDFSKAEAGKLELELEEIDLNRLIISSLRLQEPRAATGNITLEKDLPANSIIIKTDSKRLKQILLNLLSNSVKFTPPEGKVKVSMWHSLSDNTVCIEVSDTGIGIAPKDLAKAMSPFGQVSSNLSRKYEGTGLGLPLTKKFVALLGGEMEVQSDVGQGTKVKIFLPQDSSKDKIVGKVTQIIA